MSKQAELIPISPDVLRWARESLGLSVSDVAKRLKKDASIIQEWENGVSLPTYPQLEKLAYEIYKRPLAVFFMSKPPAEPSMKQEFRNIPSHLIDTLPQKVRLAVRKVKYQQLALKEIYTVSQVSQPIHKSFLLGGDTDIQKITGNIREFLGLSFMEIKKLKDYDEAFKFYRDKTEQNGIFIFQDNLDSVDGFCLYDPEFPVICVNSATAPQKKIFTIFHELAHILLHSNDILTPMDDNDATEILCNNFASEILVPTDIFLDEKLVVNTNESILWPESDISALAANYKVSREVILRKLLNLNLTTPEYYKMMVKKWADDYRQREESKKGEEPKEGGPNYHNVNKSKLGKNFVNTIITAYHDSKIDMLETAKILRIKVERINEYENIS